MFSMNISCGIFLFRPDGKLLICHAGGMQSNRGWGIPKGGCSGEESYKDTAIRETLEECGIDVNRLRGKMIYIGERKYKNKNKKLVGFVFVSTDEIKDANLMCSTNFETDGGVIIPEVDMYRWVTIDEAMMVIHNIQSELLELWSERSSLCPLLNSPGDR